MPALDGFHSKQAAYAGLRDPAWAIYAESFTATVRGEVSNALGNLGYQETGRELTERMATTLDLAEIYYCAPLMNRMVTAAAEEWLDDETIEVEDFPTDAGWLLVPGGLTMIDIRGRSMRTDALSWRVRGHLVEVTFWADKRYDTAAFRGDDPETWDLMTQWSPWHLTQLELGKPLPQTLQLGKVLPPEVSAQVRWERLSNGNITGRFPQGWTPEELTPGLKTDGVCAWLISMLRIMMQPLAAIHTEGLPANVRRAHRKTRVRIRQTRVTVIDFRRRESDFTHHGEREYSHRFLRRGHWRRANYKRDDGTWDKRRVWIHATIVGDPSKPLILREHVNSLRR